MGKPAMKPVEELFGTPTNAVVYGDNQGALFFKELASQSAD